MLNVLAMLKTRSEYRSNTFLIVLLLLLVVQGCASVPERHPLPEEKYAESRVLGMSDLRFWSDDPLPASQDLIEPTLEELQALFPAFVGREIKYVDESLMDAIAAEYRRGRLLLIGTTNLDAARPVTWDIGAIASSGQPGALDLIREVMLASASIPVAFPPVMVDVEVNGQRYDEMHVDGGATRQSFLFHLATDEDAFQALNIVGRGRAFFIHNAKLDPKWKTVDRKILPIAVRSASSMILTNGSGDLYREYLGAQKFDFDFNLAYISGDVDADEDELFDRNYMRKLYDFAYESAVNGYSWKKFPPALKTM